MYAIVKILPINYILKGNLLKFSIANNLCYMVAIIIQRMIEVLLNVFTLIAVIQNYVGVQ